MPINEYQKPDLRRVRSFNFCNYGHASVSLFLGIIRNEKQSNKHKLLIQQGLTAF